jgi:hypothetical protein
MINNRYDDILSFLTIHSGISLTTETEKILYLKKSRKLLGKGEINKEREREADRETEKETERERQRDIPKLINFLGNRKII